MLKERELKWVCKMTGHVLTVQLTVGFSGSRVGVRLPIARVDLRVTDWTLEPRGACGRDAIAALVMVQSSTQLMNCLLYTSPSPRDRG
eukprot:4187964-Amphidinium_carterae.1